ncbi:MAG TPA: carboxyl transferase domain-containing protein [Solirubrobacteraceae bacterium]
MSGAAPIVAQPAGRAEPLERLRMLCDPGTVRPLGGDGGGVLAAAGRVAGRAIVCYAQDPGHAGGSVGIAEADAVVRAQREAGRERVPLVAFLASAGARLQEGTAALGGFGRIFSQNVRLAGRVPQISVITGTSAGGGCYSPALTDFIVMTRPSAMFLTGPRVVREALGEEVEAAALGGVRVHERNGVCQFAADDDPAAAALVRDLLAHLPQRAGQAPPRTEPVAPADATPFALPANGRHVYDVRSTLGRLVDAGRFLEVSPRWARNIVVGFARIEGEPVGVVANQPRHLGGAIDAEASQKGARFVHTCNAFGVPLVVLVDTPGFLPGRRQEAAGIIRHGAALLSAFAGATVPRLTVVLRKAYGGAYITMNSKDLGADRAFAWRGAEIGIMSPRAAVQIIHRRELAGRPADELAEAYRARHLSAERALEMGAIDEVIEPAQTRERIATALADAERPAARRTAAVRPARR